MAAEEKDRVQLPVLGLQEAGGKLSHLLTTTFASGNFHVAPATCEEAKDRLIDLLGCLARICGETAILMERLAAAQLNAQAEGNKAEG